jgi:hypothetical protein
MTTLYAGPTGFGGAQALPATSATLAVKVPHHRMTPPRLVTPIVRRGDGVVNHRRVGLTKID